MTLTNSRPTDLAGYARVLRSYCATLSDSNGTVTGTCRELFAHDGAALEWRAQGSYDRRVILRNDIRLVLGKAI